MTERRRFSLRRARPAGNEPKQPFYKDERILGGRIQVSVSVRFLLAALIIFVLVVAFGMIRYIQATQQVQRSQSQTDELIDSRYKDRIASQKQQQAEIARNSRNIADLACSMRQTLDDDPGDRVQRDRIDALLKRLKYRCDTAGRPVAQASVAPSPSPSPTPTSTATGEAALVPPATSSRSASSSLTVTPPRPTRRPASQVPTAVRTPAAPSAPGNNGPSSKPTQQCVLDVIGLLCVLPQDGQR